jgi:YbbR domain-containing protein
MGFLLENLPLKAASLALAVLLWFVIAGEKTSERGISVPLELQNFPKDLELTGDPLNSVEVRLRASPGIIHGLRPGEISAQLNLAGAGEGERIIPLTAEAIRVPFGVRVVKITPASITLNLERTIDKVVPIRPRILGRPAPGFEVGEVTSNPPEIHITGPKSRVQEVESAFTEPVSVEEAKAPVVEAVNIGLEDPVLRVQGALRARISVRVQEIHEKRAFDGLPVTPRGGAALLRPSAVRVVVTGTAESLRGLAAGDLKPYVELGPNDGSGRLPVEVEVGPGHPGVSVLLTEPAQVTVRAPRKKD